MHVFQQNINEALQELKSTRTAPEQQKVQVEMKKKKSLQIKLAV